MNVSFMSHRSTIEFLPSISFTVISVANCWMLDFSWLIFTLEFSNH